MIMIRTIAIAVSLSACITSGAPITDAVQQDSQVDSDRCGPLPRLEAHLSIELRVDGTVVLPRDDWNALIQHMIDMEHWGFCMGVPPQDI